jgi:hypothetical protein
MHRILLDRNPRDCRLQRLDYTCNNYNSGRVARPETMTIGQGHATTWREGQMTWTRPLKGFRDRGAACLTISQEKRRRPAFLFSKYIFAQEKFGGPILHDELRNIHESKSEDSSRRYRTLDPDNEQDKREVTKRTRSSEAEYIKYFNVRIYVSLFWGSAHQWLSLLSKGLLEHLQQEAHRTLVASFLRKMCYWPSDQPSRKVHNLFRSNVNFPCSQSLRQGPKETFEP